MFFCKYLKLLELPGISLKNAGPSLNCKGRLGCTLDKKLLADISLGGIISGISVRDVGFSSSEGGLAAVDVGSVFVKSVGRDFKAAKSVKLLFKESGSIEVLDALLLFDKELIKVLAVKKLPEVVDGLTVTTVNIPEDNRLVISAKIKLKALLGAAVPFSLVISEKSGRLVINAMLGHSVFIGNISNLFTKFVLVPLINLFGLGKSPGIVIKGTNVYIDYKSIIKKQLPDNIKTAKPVVIKISEGKLRIKI